MSPKIETQKKSQPLKISKLALSRVPRAGTVSRTEDASAAAEGFPQSVESAVLRAVEDAFDVTGCRFLRFRKCIRWSRRLFSAPLKMRSVHQKAVSGTECLRKRLPCRKRGFSCTECPFRTIGGPLRYRMPTTQPPSHHSTPSTPVPNARHTEASCRHSGAWRTF